MTAKLARVRRTESAGETGGPARKRAIARSFDAAAGDYDAHAPVQRRAAKQLAERISALALAARPRILEIGCGTGFLSAALVRHFPDARCLFTDLSPAMVGRCRAKISRRGGAAQLAVMDGEALAAAGPFDLIASSFAFQWFLDLPAAIAAMGAQLASGGHLAFATLGAESFGEWRGLHHAAGVPFAGLNFPDASALSRIAADAGLDGTVAEERIVRRYPGPIAFLRELKSLGAGTPAQGTRPLSIAELRRALRMAGGARDFAVTYHVLYGSFAAPAAGR